MEVDELKSGEPFASTKLDFGTGSSIVFKKLIKPQRGFLRRNSA